GFPLLDGRGEVQRIAGIFEDVSDARLAAEHQEVLLSELQHRVRNIMAVIRAITARTADSAGSVAEYASLMGGRLVALARVQALLTRSANLGVDVATIVHDELRAQVDRSQYGMSGPHVIVAPKAAEVLALAVHELATNALKYGALAAAE